MKRLQSGNLSAYNNNKALFYKDKPLSRLRSKCNRILFDF